LAYLYIWQTILLDCIRRSL